MLVSTLLSIMWHIVIVVIFVIGIPFFQRDIDNSDPLVFITIVDEVPETNQPAPSAKATTQSEKIEVASRTPPAPSNAPPPAPIPSSKTDEEAAEITKKIQADTTSPLADKPEPEQAPIVLPETKIDSQKKPIAKPVSAPEKVAIAAPAKRPNIPEPQKKPISRPEVKPAKKAAVKEPVSKPETPKSAQPAKITARDLLKPLIDSKPVPKPKLQNQRVNALKKETPVENRDSTMSGVLQNLAQASAATVQKSRSKAPVEDKKTLDAEEINTNLQGSLQVKPNRTMKLGANEIDRLRAHIAQCWSPPAVAPDAEKLKVVVRVLADSDGTVTYVEFMDSVRFKKDIFYRTAARAAVRAIEECSPLPLPAEKHEAWKEFTFNFDPKFLGG